MFSEFSTEEIKTNFTNFKTMNPAILALLSGIVNIIPGAVNTIGSIFRNKKNPNPKTDAIMPALAPDIHNIADGIDLSSKVVIGYGLGGTIVAYALAQPMSKLSVIILAIGALVVAVTTVAKVFEK